jgi:autotransporter-associated beta strand protein
MTNISDSVSTQTVNAWTVQKQLNCSFQSNGPMVSGCSNSGSGEERYTSTGTMSIGSSSEIPVGSPITVVLKTTQDSGGPQPRGSLKVWSTDVDCPLAIIPISSGRVEFTARAGDALNYQFQYLNSFFCTNTSLTMSSNVNLTMTLAPGYSLGSFFAPGSAGWMQPGVWASNVYPHNTGDVAYFGNSIGANATVTLDGNRTLGGLSFNNTEGRSYTIAQGTGGTLTISSSSNSFSMISVSGDGSHTITAPLALNNSSLAVNITTDASMEVSGPLSGWADVTKNGGGTLILSGTNSHTGSWTISSGTLAVDLDGSISPTKILTNNAVFRILGHSVTTGRIEGTGTTEVLNGTLTTPSILQDTLIIGAEDSATAVPEPSAWLMIFTVGMGVAIFFRKHLS